MSILIVTSLGDIIVDLFTDECPLTSKNFLKLCKKKYYHGCLFHKVEKDFIAQTGDPTGTGTGGDSIYKFLYGDQARFFDDEIHPNLKHTKTGTVAMASAGENCNASQFYFTLRDDLDYLDGKHTVFGIVAEGLDVLNRINEAYLDDKGRPLKNIRIKHTHILDDPFSDPPQIAELIPDRSPEGKPQNEIAEERLEDDWKPMDEVLGPAELEKALRAKEAQTNAVILESTGDIPDADIKPPDNVLFVCKLNPVTEDEDLYTIFSRFGTVTSADIIRDFKTGDSLCYAFIEFENKESCELAYFKMDNALIDDRRIHVDFSQSVAKQWSEYRRGKRNQSGKGSGCFKCGAADHIAKDCNQDSDTRERPQKYVLKDENAQRGGDVSKSYDMVFDGDDAAIPEYHENGAGDQKKTEKIDHRDSRDSGHRSHERSERHEDKNRRHREDERIHRSSRDDAHEQHRERAYGEGEKAKDRISDRHGRNERDYDRHKDGDRHRRNERGYERNRESDRRRSNDGDTRNRAISSDKHKRNESDHYAKSRGDQDRNRGDDGDRRKRSGGNDAEYERDRKHR